MGYLYVMECELPTGDTVCKIGISEHSPERRQQAIQTGCPYKISRRWQSRNIPDYRQCETQIHNELKNNRTYGEWFQIDFTKAAVLADKICKGENGSQLEKRILAVEKKQAQLKKELAYCETEIDNLRYEIRGCLY